MKESLIGWAIILGIIGLIVLAISIIVSLWWLIFPLLVLFVIIGILVAIFGK